MIVDSTETDCSRWGIGELMISIVVSSEYLSVKILCDGRDIRHRRYWLTRQTSNRCYRVVWSNLQSHLFSFFFFWNFGTVIIFAKRCKTNIICVTNIFVNVMQMFKLLCVTNIIIRCYSVTAWTQAQSHLKHLTDVWPNVSRTNGGKHTTFKPSKHITLVCPVSPQRSLTGGSNICIKCSY